MDRKFPTSEHHKPDFSQLSTNPSQPCDAFNEQGHVIVKTSPPIALEEWVYVSKGISQKQMADDSDQVGYFFFFVLGLIQFIKIHTITIATTQ